MSSKDIDPIETSEWLEALNSVIEEEGIERASFLLTKLAETINQEGATPMELALVAKEFMTAARQGEVEVKHEQTRDDSSSAQVIDDEL